MSERIRTILKKVYVTELQNEVLNQIVNDTGLQTYSNYARRMIFKETSLCIQFSESQFDEVFYSLNILQNNLRKLSKISAVFYKHLHRAQNSRLWIFVGTLAL
ncbi:hypothetical protein, partial [Streptococcus thoraltensis]